MAVIRLSTNCTNCSELSDAQFCNIHQVKVNGNYTCDSFSPTSDFHAQRQCTSCVRYKTDSCAHPATAAEGMLCASWAPIAN